MNKIDILLHPVRFRIIQSFLDGQSNTAKKLAQSLKDIPQATLYRQLDTLVKADVLLVVEENQIRGTVEKVYVLNLPSISMNNDDLSGVTKEEHLQYFLFFTAELTKSFQAYLERDQIDFEKDGVGYRQVALNLSDDELIEFTQEMRKVYERFAKNKPAENRRKRNFSTIMIPDEERSLDND